MSPSEVQEKSQGQTCTVYSLSDIDGPFRGVTTTGTETESWLCKAEPWPTMRTGGPFGSQPTRQREKNALPKLLSGGSSRKLPGHLQNTNPGSEHRKKTLYFLSDGALTCGLWFLFLFFFFKKWTLLFLGPSQGCTAVPAPTLFTSEHLGRSRGHACGIYEVISLDVYGAEG